MMRGGVGSSRRRMGAVLAMTARRFAVAAGVMIATLLPVHAQQRPAPAPPGPSDQKRAADPSPQQTPTFREGVNFVRVDAIVTDKQERPVTDLQASDVTITEDGHPQTIQQFQLVRVDGNPPPGQVPREIRDRDDEEAEAARDDVRVFAIFFDDYHVRLGNSLSVREPLTRFVRTQLGPDDLVTIMYPLTPVSDLSFTRNADAIVSAIEQFQGRKYNYQPRNATEVQYAHYPTEVVERIRNEVAMDALRGLAVRLGSLRTGRKSIIYVSEGFTVQLPPEMRRSDAREPQRAPAITNDRIEQTNETFNQADLYARMRDVYAAANRNNASIYALDPRGLAAGEFDIDDGGFGGQPSLRASNRALQLTQDTLRTLADETDGRAIVNRNDLSKGLAQISRDASTYYLIGYTSTAAATDGKFHEIKVRVKRPGVEVRARRGYWAITAEDARRAATPAPVVTTPVQQALASIAPSVEAARFVRTWVGTEPGANGKTRVSMIWEPLAGTGRAGRDDTPGRISLLAATGTGSVVYRGRSTPIAPTSSVAGSGPVASPDAPRDAPPAAQQVTFDAPPGPLELRVTIERAGGPGTLDQEIRQLDVPDFTSPEPAITTPRVFRTRTARDVRVLAQDGSAMPTADREFTRAERLLVRFSVSGAGVPTPTAALLNRTGQKMADLPVAPAQAGGTHQVDMGLNTIPAGDYLLQITAGGARQLVPFRIK